MPSARPPKDARAAGAEAFLGDVARRVDACLDEWLPREGDGAPRLAEAMRYSVFAGGKRLRPALALAACRAVGGRDDVALPYAAALELGHTYSLIHDDLPAMDDDDLRRGKPTSHRVFGEALAILAGDALHTHAFGLVLGRTRDGALARDLAAELAEAAGFRGMVGGQVEDLAAASGAPTVERLERIHRAKTGALFVAAVRGGGRAGGAGPEALDALVRYGTAIGLAFQIADDVLDETGTAESLGKTPGKDRAVAKMTYVRLEGIEAARARARRERDRAVAAAGSLPSPDLLVSLARFVTDRQQ
jgi:geranylgeranyl diphosphate synthase type II